MFLSLPNMYREADNADIEMIEEARLNDEKSCRTSIPYPIYETPLDKAFLPEVQLEPWRSLLNKLATSVIVFLVAYALALSVYGTTHPEPAARDTINLGSKTNRISMMLPRASPQHTVPPSRDDSISLTHEAASNAVKPRAVGRFSIAEPHVAGDNTAAPVKQGFEGQ